MVSVAFDKVLDRATAVARDVLGPGAAAVDREAEWPERSVRALQEAGLGGLVVPEAASGLGLGLGALARITEVLGAACASSALCFGMHCVGAAIMAAKATDEQVERYLQPIAEGRHITTLALSEPGTGSHFWLPQTSMRRSSDGFVVTGTKTFVTNGSHADSYVVSTVAGEPSAPVGQFSCLVVPGDTPGLVWGAPWRGVGMRGNSSRSVELRAIEVDGHGLLGADGDQIWYVFNVVAPYFLVAMAGTYLGVAAAGLLDARDHLVGRRYAHDGSRLAEQPVLQHRIGSLWAVVERTRRLLHFAADQADAGDPEALLALCSAKAEVADCVTRVTTEAMSLMGGIGYREGAAMERRLRDAQAAHVMSPTTDLLRTWAGRSLLGENLLAD